MSGVAPALGAAAVWASYLIVLLPFSQRLQAMAVPAVWVYFGGSGREAKVFLENPLTLPKRNPATFLGCPRLLPLQVIQEATGFPPSGRGLAGSVGLASSGAGRDVRLKFT